MTLKEKIEAELNSLKDVGWEDKPNFPKLAKELGYKNNPFLKLDSPEYNGSEQLLTGLALLKKVIQLQKQLDEQPAPKTNRELILELTERVTAIEHGLRTVANPPQRSTHYEGNALISSDQFAEIAEVTAQKLLAAITSAAAPATTKHPPTTARPVEKDRP